MMSLHRYPTVAPWDGQTDLPVDVLVKKILSQNDQPARGSYPGYKRGTKSFAGDCGLPGPSDRIVGGTEATPHQVIFRNTGCLITNELCCKL